MTEAQLYTLVRAVLIAGFASRVEIDPKPEVRQANQPRVTGAPDGPAVFLSNISTHRYGFLRRKDEWVVPWPDYPDGAMVHTETQAVEVTLQCGALVPVAPSSAGSEDPPTPATYTAGDLCSVAARILASDAGREALKAGGVGIERIMEIRQPTFTDDRGQFEASPSFDFVLAFNLEDLTVNPIVETEEFEIVAI